MTDDRPKILHSRLTEVLAEGWRSDVPWGYPHQAELALVAGVFRAQMPQASADAVVDTVMRARPQDLLDDFATTAAGGVDGVIASLGSRWGDTNVLGVPVLRAEVIHGAATEFVRLGVHTAEQLRTAAEQRPEDVEGGLLKVRGLGLRTWQNIAFFAHARVRPDADVMALVAGMLGAHEQLDKGETADLIRLTARRFASDERTLTAAIRVHLAELAA